MKSPRSLLSVLTTVLLTLVLFVGSAPAANRSGAYSLSPMAGGYVFEGDQDLDDALTYSLGLGYNLTDSWSTEFVLNYFDAEAESRSGEDVDGLVYRLDALYHFIPEHSLVPFLAGGVGGITLDPDHSRSDTDFLINYGVGLKYFLTDSLALRGDLRHIFAFGDPENNFIYSAGITYQFGGRDRTSTPAPRPLDSDGDGVLDGIDRCADTPGGVAVDQVGCPLDRDGDGVPDHLDACPGTPSGVKVDPNGCPPDNDGDGVADYLDQCPNTTEDLTVDEKGCPISLTLSIQFDTDKADIKPVYDDELARGAVFIKKYPGQKILIAGHTDSAGSADYNQTLSRLRAESVRRYLIENFHIDGDRLLARGFGETAPIADNGTAAGRRNNRRVELSCCAVVPK